MLRTSARISLCVFLLALASGASGDEPHAMIALYANGAEFGGMGIEYKPGSQACLGENARVEKYPYFSVNYCFWIAPSEDKKTMCYMSNVTFSESQKKIDFDPVCGCNTGTDPIELEIEQKPTAPEAPDVVLEFKGKLTLPPGMKCPE